MRVCILALVLSIAVTACSDGGNPMTAVPPEADAPERITMPAKCKEALTFDKECVELFDRAFGNGSGSAERSRLNVERAHSGWGSKKSTAKPAPLLGTQN